MNFNFFSSERREFLLAYGWSAFFDQQLHEDEIETTVAARVIGEERELYRIQIAHNLSALAFVKGRLRYESTGREDFPAVGDWVLINLDEVEQTSAADLEHSRARFVIRRILDRRTALARKQVGAKMETQIIASNIDHVFIATSMNQDFNLRRLDRYVAMTEQSGAMPIVLMTKRDLSSSPEELMQQVKTRFPAVLVIAITSQDFESITGIHEIATPGTTNVIVGSSGVGKSTLMNHLMQTNVLTTQEVRDFDSRGRHTTTSRYLMATPQGALFIDTPGMRELQFFMDDTGSENESVFSDIVSLMSRCRFSDCCHQTEPGCAIRRALDEGELDGDRWMNYIKMLREQDYLNRKNNIVAQSKERERWKKISISLRQKYKIENK